MRQSSETMGQSLGKIPGKAVHFCAKTVHFYSKVMHFCAKTVHFFVKAASIMVKFGRFVEGQMR
jgi:hypothetical protein